MDSDNNDSADPNGVTPLHLAAEANHRSRIFALLKAGANPNALTSYHETPLSLLLYANRNCAPAVRMLLNAGADPLLPQKDRLLKILNFGYRTDLNTLTELLTRGGKIAMEPGDEIDPEVVQRKPSESDRDYYHRKWRVEKSAEALSGLFQVYLSDESLHHCDSLIELFGTPDYMKDGEIEYSAKDSGYYIDFLYDTETRSITSWHEP